MRPQANQILKQRTLDGRHQHHERKLQASFETMSRLQLESCLSGHIGCVNCLEWNQAGDLLASGSDDHQVIIWNPFKGTKQKQNVIKTTHTGNIFSVKFMPASSDNLLATCASDNEVKLNSILSGEPFMNCKSCHIDRVKRLATHQKEPHLIWSAGEDGYIMQYDIRENHFCSTTKPKNLILDLKTASQYSPIARCLALNPIRDEMLAIGCNDTYIRLFDRRYLKREEAWGSCTAYFTPGHLKKTNEKKSCPRSYGTTYLTFSPNGSELLANIHAEQVYLFNTYQPNEAFKSFEQTIKPLIYDMPINVDKLSYKTNSYSRWKRLRESNNRVDLPVKYRPFYEQMMTKLKSTSPLRKEDIERVNTLIGRISNCAELYHLRAALLIIRGWKGDYYQAILDSCCALALNPLDYISLENLSIASYYSRDKELAFGLLEVLKLIRKDTFTKNVDFHRAIRILQALIRDSPISPNLSRLDFQLESPSLSPDGSIDQDLINENDSYNMNTSYSNIHPPYYSIIPHSDTIHLANMAFISNNNDPINMTTLDSSRKELQRCSNSFDYNKRFCGHCNMNTDIKEANFFGRDGDFIVAGSDDGAFYIWDKNTTNIVKAVHGDQQILNCLQPHPSICMLATSGIEPFVKIWSPIGKSCHDVKSLEQRCVQNQDFITSDPLEAMIMMLYPNRDILE